MSKRWAPKYVLLLHGKHSLVPPCKNSLILGGGKDLSRSQGDLAAKRNVFSYVTTHGLRAGFPITNGFLLNSRGQSPSPFLAGTKQGHSTWARWAHHIKTPGDLSSIFPAKHPLRRAA